MIEIDQLRIAIGNQSPFGLDGKEQRTTAKERLDDLIPDRKPPKVE